MRRIHRATLILAGLLAGTANAAPWATIARNVESVVEIDSGSLTRKGQSVRAWSRQVYSEDQPLPLGDPPFRAVRYFYAYECGKRTALLVRRTYVDEQGQPIKDQILDGLEMARDVIPGTLQERVYEYACKASKDAEKVAAVATTKTDAASVDGKVVSKKGKNGIKKEDQQAEERLGKEADAEEGNRENAEDVSEKEAKGKEKKAIGEQTSEATLKEEKGHGKSSVKPAKASQRKSTKPKDEDDAEHGKAGQGESEDQEERAEEDHGKGHGKPDKVVMLEKAKKGKHDLDDKCVGCNRADDEEKADQKPEKGDGHAHWDYEGKNGPQNWAKLSPEFATCGSGKFQSPIDIKEGIKLSLEPIKFDWKPSALKILDNGHTVQVNYGSGSSITVNGERYELVQFHFHKPSEERIDGKAFDMVAHFVHKNGSGSLAVVAAMLRNGAPNPLIQTLWTHLPLQPGKENSPKDVKIDANQLLPADRAYYTFLGSLTTPPCTEGVLWLVMKNPLQVSRSQIAAFGRLYETNARPIQPSNRRLIKESL